MAPQPSRSTSKGFTLIETFVAISILMLAIVAPMSLAEQSLAAAYYARDQITAYYLGQEGIEIVRSVRDANIIAIAKEGSGDAFAGIPAGPFTVNAVPFTGQPVIDTCESGGCPPLQTDGSVYGYSSGCLTEGTNWETSDCGTTGGWTDTIFTRSVTTTQIGPDEMRVTVTVNWQDGSYPARKFIISEDLYRWVENSSGS